MYCEFSELQDWGKRSGEGRRQTQRYCLKFSFISYVQRHSAILRYRLPAASKAPAYAVIFFRAVPLLSFPPGK